MRTSAVLLLLIAATQVMAQADTLLSLEEVVVTATRQERRLGNITIPVNLIQRRIIQQAGSLRLKDILQEQPGIQLTSNFGTGIQMQGLNPEHTLILLDGQPLIGRTSGVLDVSRIAVAGIKRIEIVKGPSSSLYGSEAMAGVINLITENPSLPLLEASLRYGVADPDQGWGVPFKNNSFQQTEATVDASYSIRKLKVKHNNNLLFADGVSFRPFSQVRVPRPIHRITHQTSIQQNLGNKAGLKILGRINQDRFQQEFSVSNNGMIIDSYGRELNNELNIQPTLFFRLSEKIRLHTRGYLTSYSGDQLLRFVQKPDSSYRDRFEQRLFRIEEQIDFKKENYTITAGVGYQVEQANSTRYDALANQKQNNVSYVFAQWELKGGDKWISILGARYDHHTLFSGAVTPKWSLRYKAKPSLSFTASVGQGFKAPDFRQLYLNFTNTVAGGYSVFGTQDAIRVINALNRLGQIAELKPDFTKLTTLSPEHATGINVSAQYTPTPAITWQVSIFRNDIQSLIDVRQVATRVDGSQLFSYLNVNRAFTQGVETSFQWQLQKKWSINAGYQLLLTGDKEEWERIKQGKEYIRESNGSSRVMNKKDYIGLPNRSKQQAQLKIKYEDKESRYVYMRLLYRSRWTVANSNGNGVHDVQDEYAKGFMQLHITGGLPLSNTIALQAGIDNVLNYQDVFYLPNVAGRTVFVTLRATLESKQSKK
ncbi:MAG: TonB-dependent receptor [Bacteroidetes bacterium]|nr:TonB-dependent receptor [Bacteroidota bacterium]